MSKEPLIIRLISHAIVIGKAPISFEFVDTKKGFSGLTSWKAQKKWFIFYKVKDIGL